MGRVRRAPGGQPQTMIDLGYISSGHCCVYLAEEKKGGAIDAMIMDMSR